MDIRVSVLIAPEGDNAPVSDQ